MQESAAHGKEARTPERTRLTIRLRSGLATAQAINRLKGAVHSNRMVTEDAKTHIPEKVGDWNWRPGGRA
jgi:hypothetical protein